ncbi:TrmH family RNA methyltransferase [Desulfohalovibrio reitneri]|uniref:TrmH family RNA methyltransferase n=1 Tax=Desulfohalovibrio reitneri TaxID=1307759 RepID=UPI0004A6ABC9|nr:RNA methyltransferase [Desulfohalovibrio reitneri]
MASERAPGDPGADETVWGRKPVLEWLESAPGRIESVVVQRGGKGGALGKVLDVCRRQGVRFRLAERAELEREVPPGVNHQGVAARLAPAPLSSLDDLLDGVAEAPLPVLLALDQVQDTGNLGALARSLLALGGAGLLLPRHGSARLGGGASKASAGALARLPVAHVTNLAKSLDVCRDRGLFVYGAAGGGGNALSAYGLDPAFPCVLVLGNEEKGLRPNVAKRCDALVEIPMPGGFESLGVAQAGAMLLALLARAQWM